MNVSELARRVRMPLHELREVLPQLGFDIGQKAIKIDERTAQRIIESWPMFQRRIEEQKRKEMERKRAELIAQNLNKEVAISSFISVRDFAKKLELPVNQIITELMKNGVLASLNERIDFDTAAIIGEDLGVKVVKLEGVSEGHTEETTRLREILQGESSESLCVRPPVVVVMGHVDHGKTKLLDAIQKTDVVSQERGGITQHIGAYQVDRNGRKITFIDTPGHEAFSAMRSRGAKVADIAILVVAADDSLKPQTIEAIKIIQKESLPMIVAINKIDKPEANIDKVKQDLSAMNLSPEDWGGKTITVPISAKDGTNIDRLLEMLLLVAEMDHEKMMANPIGVTAASIIDSRISKGEGNVATLIIQNGTLRTGDYLYINNTLFGRVRSMKDWYGNTVSEATPSMPVKLIGLKVPPQVGDLVEASVEKKDVAVADKRTVKASGQAMQQLFTVDEEKEKKAQGISIILKTDVLGSAEAICESLAKIDHPDVYVKVISRRLGNIIESDIAQAEGEKAMIIGFNVNIAPQAAWLAKEKKIAVQRFFIIYELIDFVKKELQKFLTAEVFEEKIGSAEVIAVFRKEGKQSILGCRVKDGVAQAGTKAKIWRKDQLLVEGTVEEIRVGKEVVKDVLPRQECGVKFVGKPLGEVGDMIEFIKEEVREKKII
jgi:translation initiation factor IF-2